MAVTNKVKAEFSGDLPGEYQTKSAPKGVDNKLEQRKNIFGRNYTPIQARKLGGPVDQSTPYLVGEDGPELLVPASDGTVVPNDQLGTAMPQQPQPLPTLKNLDGSSEDDQHRALIDQDKKAAASKGTAGLVDLGTARINENVL